MSKKEQNIVEWTESPRGSFNAEQKNVLLIVSLISFVSMLGLAIWLKDLDFYLAAGVCIAIGSSIFTQKKVPAKINVSLSLTQLQIGSRIYPNSELAGFWLQKNARELLVHIENRRSIMPITLQYPSLVEEQARAQFIEVLPELEPRDATLNDKIADWLKL